MPKSITINILRNSKDFGDFNITLTNPDEELQSFNEILPVVQSSVLNILLQNETPAHLIVETIGDLSDTGYGEHPEFGRFCGGISRNCSKNIKSQLSLVFDDFEFLSSCVLED